MTGSQDWILVLEFDVPRRAKRIDAVLLTGSAVIVLEFKVGAMTFDRAALRQVEDYALDLFDFHADSQATIVVPVVIATGAKRRMTQDTSPSQS